MWIMMCQHSLISLISRESSCPNLQPEGFSSGGGGLQVERKDSVETTKLQAGLCERSRD